MLGLRAGVLVIRQKLGHGFGADELALDFFPTAEEARQFVADLMSGTPFPGPVYLVPADEFTRKIDTGPRPSDPGEPPGGRQNPRPDRGRSA
jgi:hypothetical protein